MALKESIKHVSGHNYGDVTLYALSTCGWCRKTKGMLEEIGIEYNYVDVDLLKEDEKQEALEQIKHHNPKCTFPTMVINDNSCIVGFKEEETREALGIGK